MTTGNADHDDANTGRAAERNGDAWGPCPSGEIGGLVRRRASQRRREMLSGLAGGAAIAIVAVGLVGWFARPQGLVFGGIDCRTCLANAPAYFSGELRDRELVASIREHLAECPRCGPHFEGRERREPATAARSVVYAPIELVATRR